MASSVYDTGYEDELFQYPVGSSLHCCICTNVIKDPVMCHNEHIFSGFRPRNQLERRMST